MNIGADNSASTFDPDTYDLSIPTAVSPGAYTLAWTWCNKVGNRELYVNCASINATGGSNKRDIYLNKTDFAVPGLFSRETPFPAMVVAEIPVSDCTTAQRTEEIASAHKADILALPTGPKCAVSASSASDDGGDVAATSSSAPNAPPNTPSMSTVALSVATTPSAAVSLSPSLASTPAPAPTDGSSDARATPAFSSGSASHGFSTSSCTTQGQSICSPDGLQIGICTMESTVTWRAWIPMAAGTKCAGGYMVGAKGRRSAKFLSDYFFWRAAPRLQASL